MEQGKERISPIILTMEDGTEYTLEFNRKTVDFAERRGFKLDDVGDYMMVKVPELFFYAFMMHHPYITKKQTDEILFEKLKGINDEVLRRLTELFTQGYDTLINSGEAKNSNVTITM